MSSTTTPKKSIWDKVEYSFNDECDCDRCPDCGKRRKRRPYYKPIRPYIGDPTYPWWRTPRVWEVTYRM